jgi:hypothetical protein
VDLAEQADVGLPRSKLIKSKLSDVAPAPAVASPTPALGLAPFDATIAGLGAPVSFTPAPFNGERTVPLAFSAFAAPRAPVDLGDTTLRDAVGAYPETTHHDAPPVSRDLYPSSPSARELVERAAALGPVRSTWDSMVLPADPILDEKQQPYVAERRERFTRMVKFGLAACVGVCALAVGISALSGSASASTGAATSAAALGNTVPSKGIIPVEALEATKHGKAVRKAPAVAIAGARTKRR